VLGQFALHHGFLFAETAKADAELELSAKVAKGEMQWP